MVHLAPILSNGSNVPTPPNTFILNIEGATDHSCLENCNGAKYKIFTVTFSIFNKIIFHLDGFQLHHSLVISTIHMVTCVHCSLFIHHIKFRHGQFHFFGTFFWFKRGSSRVLLKYPKNFDFFLCCKLVV